MTIVRMCWYCRRGFHLICPRHIRDWRGSCDCSYNLAQERVGMFLEVDYGTREATA